MRRPPITEGPPALLPVQVASTVLRLPQPTPPCVRVVVAPFSKQTTGTAEKMPSCLGLTAGELIEVPSRPRSCGGWGRGPNLKGLPGF